MARRDAYHQYGDRSSEKVRSTLLSAALTFVRAVRTLAGVQRIALIGSLATAKPFPKDADMLVTVSDDMDLTELARRGRQLAGAARRINAGADVFLASPSGVYLGRTCPWKECGPGRRVRCGAEYRSEREYLRDDHRTIVLTPELIESPAVELWPSVQPRSPLPADVEALLLEALRGDVIVTSAGGTAKV